LVSVRDDPPPQCAWPVRKRAPRSLDIAAMAGARPGSAEIRDDFGPGLADDEDTRRLEQMQAKGNQRRQGIAAESVNECQVRDYVKPVYPKDEGSKQMIKQVLKANDKMQVLFGHLEGQPLEDVINAFQVMEAREGEDIIVQGAEGDRLYVICDGAVDVYVNRPNLDGSMPPGKGSRVVQLGGGALFGELALMYSAPRAATITVATPGIRLFCLDREPFKMLLAQNSQAQLEMYEGWLKEVEILKTLNHFELSTLSECLESELFDTGEVIISQGEAGDKFYIVEDGTCSAFMMGADGEKEVKQYNRQGEYFGELALLTAEPRRATVRATGEGCSVVSMSKEQFTNLLGPIEDILQKHAGLYPQYAEFLR